MQFSTLTGLASTLALATIGLAAPIESNNVKVRTVLQLDDPSWLENIAVRSNGELLVSRLDKPELYLVNPFTNKYSLIATFPGVNGSWGIAEYQPDVFAINVGNLSLANLQSVKGSYSVLSVDLNKGLDKNGKTTPKLLAKLSQASNLNGLTFRAPNTLYASDAFAFKVYEIDTRTGASKTVVQNDTLLTGGNFVPLGINGVRWAEAEKSLFFSNSDQGLVGLIPTNQDGTSFGKAQLTAKTRGTDPQSRVFDDFTLVGNDNILTTTNTGNTIVFISRDGKTQFVVAGSRNSTQIAGPTSIAFGRTKADQNTAYVVTSGDLAGPINGTVTVGAQVLALSWDN